MRNFRPEVSAFAFFEVDRSDRDPLVPPKMIMKKRPSSMPETEKGDWQVNKFQDHQKSGPERGEKCRECAREVGCRGERQPTQNEASTLVKTTLLTSVLPGLHRSPLRDLVPRS
jgi:hypothetical protein